MQGETAISEDDWHIFCPGRRQISIACNQQTCRKSFPKRLLFLGLSNNSSIKYKSIISLLYLAFWVRDKSSAESCNVENQFFAHVSWSLVCKGPSLLSSYSYFLSINLWSINDHQTPKDSANKTTDCEQVIDPNNWSWANIEVKSYSKHPEDCFVMDQQTSANNQQTIHHNTCCTACHHGQWLDEKNNTCIDCKAGHKCPSPFDLPVNGPCDPGTYQPEPRQISCEGSGISIILNV